MSRLEQIGSLARRLRRMERSRRSPEAEEVVEGTGHAALDSLLPAGGLARGRLFEWINARGPGTGAVTLALLAAGGLAGDEENRTAGVLAVVDRDGGFYPAAVAEMGLSPKGLLLVRPESETEWLWAVEQVLRSPAVDVMLTWADRIDDREDVGGAQQIKQHQNQDHRQNHAHHAAAGGHLVGFGGQFLQLGVAQAAQALPG